ncbi:hypothetical protein BGZ73_007074, partial [Actinomortierella ambigua]
MSHSASPVNGHEVPPTIMHLLPEIAHHVRAHLTTHQLASAARVCRAWHAIWMPYLWENVHHHVPYRLFPPLGKYASFIRRFEGHYLTGGYPTKDELYRRSRAAVNRRGKGVGGGGGVGGSGVIGEGGVGGGVGGGRLYHDYSMIPGASSTLSSSSPLSLPPILLQLDILRLEGTHLQELSLFKTDIGLDRLDRLLESLSQLKVFRFEVLNRVAPDYVPMSVETRPVGTWLGKSMGLLSQSEEPLLGVVATRLQRLQQLELLFDARAYLHVSWVLFLIEVLQKSLRSLKLENFALTSNPTNVKSDWEVLGIQKYADRLVPLLGSCRDEALESSLSKLSVASHTHSVDQLTSTSNINNENMTLTGIAATTTGLTSLTLIRQYWDNRIGTLCLEQVLRACPNLEELNIHDAPCVNSDTITAILDYNPKLARVAFSKLPYMTSQALERLFQGRRWTDGSGDNNHTNSSLTFTSLSSSASVLSSSSAFFSSSLFSSALASTSASSFSSLASSSSQDPSTAATADTILVPRLESVRLGYLHHSLTDPLKTLAERHGHRLRQLSIHWCPSVTTQDVWPILKKCSQLEELALQLTKVSTKIFEDIPQEMVVAEPGGNGVAVLEPKMHTWACAATLRKLDIGGPMFVDYSRYRERFLRPTVYHHLSPNPYLMGSTSPSSSSTSSASLNPSHHSSHSSSHQDTPNYTPHSSPSSSYDSSGTPPMSPSTSGPSGPSTPSSSIGPSSPPPPPRSPIGGGHGSASSSSSSSTVATGTGAAVVGGHTFNSSIVRIAAMFNNFVPPPNQHPHVERHWTDESLNPLYTLQTRLEGFPRLRELGLQTKGVEQWILKGFHREWHQEMGAAAGVGGIGGGGSAAGSAGLGGPLALHRNLRRGRSSTASSSSSGSDSLASKDNAGHGDNHGSSKPKKHEIKIQTLTLMNQQGRILDRTRVLELIASYPYLRRLVCDRSTIFHHRLTPAEKEDLERTFA